MEFSAARGSRAAYRPDSTWWRKSASSELKSAGSSRLMPCPLLGNTTSPALGIARFSMMEGSMQGSSSSPVMISVGTSIAVMRSMSV